jgi:hypothetical protein
VETPAQGRASLPKKITKKIRLLFRFFPPCAILFLSGEVSRMTKNQTKPFCLKESDSFNFYIGINAGGKLLGRVCDAKKSIKIISPYITEGEIGILRNRRIGIGLEDISIMTSAADANFRSASQVKALKKLIHREKKDGGTDQVSLAQRKK